MLTADFGKSSNENETIGLLLRIVMVLNVTYLAHRRTIASLMLAARPITLLAVYVVNSKLGSDVMMKRT